MPSVYIGRGAIIGANTVVTSDIGPYEIHGGVPNRRIGTRLDFVPPRNIHGLSDKMIPYFYRGFYLKQKELQESRSYGVIAASRAVSIVLSGPASAAIIKGRIFNSRPLQLRARFLGHSWEDQIIDSDEFELKIARVGCEPDIKPSVLSEFTVIQIEARVDGDIPAYGISYAEVL